MIMQNDTPLPAYLPYPRFLLGLPLSNTQRLVYTMLLGRAQLSQFRGLSDEMGVYIYYPIVDLARDSGKSETSIKSALAGLQEAGLILRRHQGLGRANKIYVGIPEAAISPPASQKSDCQGSLKFGYTKGRKQSRRYSKEILDDDYTYKEGESL